MRLHLSFDFKGLFNLGHVPYDDTQEKVSMTSHKEWADRVAAGERKRKQNEDLQLKARLSKEERIGALAPDAWGKLLSEVKAASDALNETGISQRKLYASTQGAHD